MENQSQTLDAPLTVPQNPESAWRSWIAALGFDLLILLVMASILAYLVNSIHSRIRWIHPSMGLPLIILVGVLLISSVQNFFNRFSAAESRSFFADWPQLIRDWLPFFLVDFIYENLHDLAAKISSWDIAPWLHQMDQAIFGFQPTLATQAITVPWMTDLMAILYAPYLAYPLILMALLSLGRHRREFQLLSLAVILTFLLGFVCYVVFPALPPRFYITQQYTDPVLLRGSYIHDHLQNVWDELSVVKGAAFPSLHVALSSIAMFFAWRFRKLGRIYRVIAFAYLPLGAGLWFSTIYLRHHWFVDILAAWVICSIAIGLSFRLNRLTWDWQEKYGEAQDSPGRGSLSA